MDKLQGAGVGKLQGAGVDKEGKSFQSLEMEVFAVFNGKTERAAKKNLLLPSWQKQIKIGDRGKARVRGKYATPPSLGGTASTEHQF